MSVSNDYRGALNASTTDRVSINLATITHPDLQDTIRVCDDGLQDVGGGKLGVISRGDTFYYVHFDYIAPDVDHRRLGRAKIVMDNVDHSIGIALQSIKGAAKIIFEEVLHTAPDVVEIKHSVMFLRSINFNAGRIEAELNFPFLEHEPFPATQITPAGCPGVF